MDQELGFWFVFSITKEVKEDQIVRTTLVFLLVKMLVVCLQLSNIPYIRNKFLSK